MPDDELRFAACLDEVLRHEGGYADHPKDPGGATNLGITIATLAEWRGVAVSKADVRALGRDEAAAIYRERYWKRVRGDALPAGLDLAVFDFAVNSGPSRAARALQRELKVAQDGLIGPVTLAALQSRAAATARLVAAVCDSRLGFLEKLATFVTFGRGWSRRVAAVRTASLTMAGANRASTSPTFDPRRLPMTFLSGYRTYIVAGLMLLAALAQLLGIDLPSLDGQSAGQLLMESLAIVFLRRGLKSDIGKA